jgi:hypothetical protein
MNSIILKLTLQYSDISELVKTSKKDTIVYLKNGDRITFHWNQGNRIFKNLCRTFYGKPIN